MNKKPPYIFLRFFRWFCHPDLRQPIEGDLMELYDERIQGYGKKKADLLFTKDILQLLRPEIIRPLQGSLKINRYGMLKNYFKIGIRNILKHKTFSFINIFGLAVAMSICMLIIMMLADQKSYDQFNVNIDRVYRIIGKEAPGSNPYATTAFSLSDKLSSDYGIIQETATLRKGVGGDASANQKTVEIRGFFTDDSFFNVLDRKLVIGNVDNALSEPRSIVISSEKAYTLFNTESPIGKSIKFENRGLDIIDTEGGIQPVDWGTYIITGVFDSKAVKSHLKFDALISSSTLELLVKEKKIYDLRNDWESYFSSYNYVLLKEGQSKEALDIALAEVSEQVYGEMENFEEYQFSSQPLGLITPGIMINNESSIKLPEFIYYIFSLLALIIMVMAGLNYTNLSIARSLKRMKEIGVRKVNGAFRKDLIMQFMTESILTSVFAMALALILLYFTKEAFMGLWVNKYLDFDLTATPSVYIIFLVFTVLIGLLAGLYPALYLSKHKPIIALKSNFNGLKGKWGMQKFLSVTQFAISLIFIVSALVIYNQFKHYTDFEYGFTSRNVVNIPLQSNDHKILTTEFAKIAGVETISACEYIPATGITDAIVLAKPESDDDFGAFLYFRVNEYFSEVLDLKLIAGKHLPENPNGNLDKYIVINESAAKKLGFSEPHMAIGETFVSAGNKEQLEIIGVIADFRASLLINSETIRPLVLRNIPRSFNYLNVKIAGNNPMKTINELNASWKSLDPVHEFRFEFMDDELAATNMAILDIVSIVGYIAFLAIVIACLGLLGMSIYATERKTKEVGIRKVLGAGERKIIFLLSKEFLKLLGIAIIVAAPLSYILNNFWLENISHRVDFGIETVIYSSLLLFALGLVTIGSQTIKASRKNPVESLKME